FTDFSYSSHLRRIRKNRCQSSGVFTSKSSSRGLAARSSEPACKIPFILFRVRPRDFAVVLTGFSPHVRQQHLGIAPICGQQGGTPEYTVHSNPLAHGR